MLKECLEFIQVEIIALSSNFQVWIGLYVVNTLAKVVRKWFFHGLWMRNFCSEPGLWTFGPPTSPVNAQVRPAFRFIISEMAKLDPEPPGVGIFNLSFK